MYLVTGGTGFLGKFLCKSLIAENQGVVVLARSKDAELESLGVIFVQGSVLEKRTIESTCDKYKITGIFHLAGLVEHSRKNPDPMYQIHIEGTLNVLQVASLKNIKRVIYASTSGTVGCSSSDKFVADDESPYASEIACSWPYYDSKIKAEIMALNYWREHQKEFDLVVMRPTLILGPDDERFSSVTIVQEYINKNIPIVPAGGLSFVDVRDVEQAFRVAMKQGKPGGKYLLGSCNASHSEFYKRLERVSGVKAPFLRVPSVILIILLRVLYFLTWRLLGIWLKEKDPVWAEMGAVFWYIDSKAARTELNFVPRDPDLTLMDTINWLRSRKK